jgi:hypothetical protein
MFRFLNGSPRPVGPAALIAGDLEEGFDYFRLAATCESHNSFNRLHIEIETVATPQEIAALAKPGAGRKLPRETRLWLERLGKLSPDLIEAPRPHGRRMLGPHVTLYGDASLPSAEKSLMVAFAGRARRLMIPVPAFLQFIDPAKWDIVLVNRGPDSPYLQGQATPEVGRILALVEAAVDLSAYRRVAALGTSGGGFPAVWAALLAGAERGVSICGAASPPLPAAVPRADGKAPDLCFVYGSDSAADRDAAQALRAAYGGRLRTIEGAEKHNVIEYMIRQGRFAAFLDEVLG